MPENFSGLFLTVYTIVIQMCNMVYESADITMEQLGLISIVVGAGAAWFGHISRN